MSTTELTKTFEAGESDALLREMEIYPPDNRRGVPTCVVALTFEILDSGRRRFDARYTETWPRPDSVVHHIVNGMPYIEGEPLRFTHGGNRFRVRIALTPDDKDSEYRMTEVLSRHPEGPDYVNPGPAEEDRLLIQEMLLARRQGNLRALDEALDVIAVKETGYDTPTEEEVRAYAARRAEELDVPDFLAGETKCPGL